MAKDKDKRIGNQFWKLRSSHGRNPKFKNPEDLWNAACEYFENVENNPLVEEKVFQYQGAIVRGEVKKMRAMSIGGLCLFLDIDKVTWYKYKDRKGFLNVSTRIEEVIRAQKFEGAAAELFNANIIARDIGLKDQQEQTHNGTFTIVRKVIKGKAQK